MVGLCLMGSFRTGIRTTSMVSKGQHQTDKTASNAGQETEFQEKSRQTIPIRGSKDVGMPYCPGWEQSSRGITGKGHYRKRVPLLHDDPYQ